MNIGNLIKSLANWRTTIAGIATALAVVFAQIGNAADADPSTVFDINLIIAAGIAMMGILSSDVRDDN